MRVSFFAAVVLQLCMPLVSWADCHASHKPGCGCHTPAPACACSQPVMTPVVAPCSTCNPCNQIRCCVPYDYTNFTQNFYAEFYARNPWYLEAKKREAAEKLKAYEAVKR